MLVGVLRVDRVKNKEHFSFAQQIDPQLHLFSGDQHSEEQNNCRVFLDSCPDCWGRLLMKRREAAIARQEGRKPNVLNEVDFLLGVHDTYRMGALRFKRDIDGEFLDNNKKLAALPISSLCELEHAAQQVELNNNPDDPEY